MKHFNVCTKVKLPYKLVTERIAHLGMSGTGKTYGATKLAEEMLDAGAQVNYIDPVGIGFGLRIGADGKKGGFDIYVFDESGIRASCLEFAVLTEEMCENFVSFLMKRRNMRIGRHR